MQPCCSANRLPDLTSCRFVCSRARAVDWNSSPQRLQQQPCQRLQPLRHKAVALPLGLPVGEASLLGLLDDTEGCSDKEKEFMAKWKLKEADEVKKQLERLDRKSVV